MAVELRRDGGCALWLADLSRLRVVPAARKHFSASSGSLFGKGIRSLCPSPIPFPGKVENAFQDEHWLEEASQETTIVS
jgi:hypothetical protein